MTEEITPNFAFGTLATDALRLEQIKTRRRGLWHNQHLHPLPPQVGQPIMINVDVGPDISADHLTLYYTTDGHPPVGEYGHAQVGQAILMTHEGPEWDTLIWGYTTCWSAIIPPQPSGSSIQYTIEAWRKTDLQVLSQQTPVYSCGVNVKGDTQWLQEAIIYQIFVDRFAPSPDEDFKEPVEGLGGFYGGSLGGIIARLDYLESLGVTCLWLTPIFPSPTPHGYDATDYSTIEPRLGNLDDLQKLFDEAHQRGMRVILDYVANHLSNQHPYFKDEAKKDWFFFTDWPETYDTFFGVQEMPRINTDHPAARDYLIDNACYWLKQGADGFRLDYAHGASHTFWLHFKRATQAANKESVLFGEVVETASLQASYAGRMDGTLDFLLNQNLRNFFAFNSMTVSHFDAFLKRHFAYFPNQFILPSFLDNHDMNRFLWIVQGDARRLRLAALCQFTLPGPPIIYYGTEVGLNQTKNVGSLEESRPPMLWGASQDEGLLTFYRALIAFRQQTMQVWIKPYRTILTDDAKNVYVYSCGGYAVILNNSPHPTTLTLKSWRKASVALSTTPDTDWQPEDGLLSLAPYGGICLSN